MSTPINFYRSGRHYRMLFREGDFLLASEGMELQLEVLQKLRDSISRAFQPYSAIEDAVKVEIDPLNNQRLLIRPGSFFIDGYPVKIEAGTDHLVKLGRSPSEITDSDFAKVDKTSTDDGGIAINFGGATPLASGQYSIIISLEEELITATDDPYLRSANLNESTADRHRLILNVNIVESSSLNKSPIPYTGTDDDNLVNEIEITRNGTDYSILDTNPLSGSEAIDGRNLEVLLDNGNGGATAAFPVANSKLEEFVQGKLIDSNGAEFHITNLFVTPGDATSVTMVLDLEKDRPIDSITNQPEPVILDSLPYKLIKRDLYVTSSANLPVGKRFFKTAEVVWDGSSFSSVEDLRQQVLAFDGVLSQIRDSGLQLYSDGNLSWDKDVNGGKLIWSDSLFIHSNFDNFAWDIPAGDTFSLFGTALAQNEVLYVRLMDEPTGGSLQLRKGIRGQGDLTLKGIQAHKVYWIAKRLSDDRVYFNNGVILNNQQTKTFFDPLPERRINQDILTLGYRAVVDEDLADASGINPTQSTGLFFAESYLLDFSTRSINISGNILTYASVPSFTIQQGDVVVQGAQLATVVNVVSQTEIEVDDASVLTPGSDAVLSQVVETFNVRDFGALPEEKVSSYIDEPIDNLLITYDDSILPTLTNPIKIGYSATADNSSFTDALRRKSSIGQIEPKTTLPSSGKDVRVKFFSVDDSGDGTATLESYRVFIHDRKFVGTLLAGIAESGTTSGASDGTAIEAPSLTNNSGSSIPSGRAVIITSSGIDLADASAEATATAVIGVTTDSVGDTLSTDSVVGTGLAGGVLTGLGFSAGDQVFLGTNGQLVNGATASGLTVLKELGFAVNANDLWVSINPLELI